MSNIGNKIISIWTMEANNNSILTRFKIMKEWTKISWMQTKNSSNISSSNFSIHKTWKASSLHQEEIISIKIIITVV